MRKGSFQTRNAEEAREYLSSVFVPLRLRVAGSTEGFQFQSSFGEAGQIRLDRLRNSMDIATETDPFGELVSTNVLRGRLEIHTSRHEVQLSEGGTCLYPLGDSLGATWSDVDMLTIRLPLEIGRRVAAELTGVAQPDFRVLEFAPQTPALGQYWLGLVRMISRQILASESALDSPLIAADMATMLARAMIRVFPTNVVPSVHVRRELAPAPAGIRRATAFIDENADQPITLSEIAAAAGVSPRALQLGFARHHESSPMAYLRRVRLERAHRQLQDGDPLDGTTVAMVAQRWGFSSASHFTQAYRLAYGRLPSHTLRS